MLLRFGAKNTVSLGSSAITLPEEDVLHEPCDREDEHDEVLFGDECRRLRKRTGHWDICKDSS